MTIKLINERRNNNIFTDEKNAYKIFNEGYSKDKVFMEAFISSKIETLNLEIPVIEEITSIDGKWAFKFQNIYGQSMYEMMQKYPDNIEHYLEQLVDIQTDIHTRKCSQLPIQKQKLTDYINMSHLDKSLKIDLLDMLNSSPKHNKLCHGNFTPHNIIMNDNKLYITDWNHASQGNASADVARTYLWMQIHMPSYAKLYLDIFCNKTGTTSRYVRNWIPIVAAARIAKNNPEEIKVLSQNIEILDY